MKQLIEAVKKHAYENYENGGWDVIVECWTDDEIEERLIEDGAGSVEDAIKSFMVLAEIWAERQADARNSAF